MLDQKNRKHGANSTGDKRTPIRESKEKENKRRKPLENAGECQGHLLTLLGDNQLMRLINSMPHW